jgi:hypothetical protein
MATLSCTCRRWALAFSGFRRALLPTLLLALAAPGLSQAPGAQDCACCAGAYRAFDFWRGDWRVHAPQKPDSLLGYNRVEVLQEGCVLQENWRSANGAYSGTSYNWYDRASDRWQQIWIDSQGGSLHLAGHWQDGAMVLSSLPGQAGPRQRITWTPLADGTVRQHWQQSKDGGQRWETLFDGIYAAR